MAGITDHRPIQETQDHRHKGIHKRKNTNKDKRLALLQDEHK